MGTEQFSPKKAMMLTKMIFLGQITGILFFMIIIYHLGRDRLNFSKDLSDPLFIAIFILSLTVIPGAYLYARKRLSNIGQEESLGIKFAAWQKSVIIRLASVEGIALLSAVFLFVSGNILFMVFFVLSLGLQSLNWPSVARISSEMNLSQSEIDQFYQNM